jgi:hypothetical protein
MKWHCDKHGNCHKKCEIARVGEVSKGATQEHPVYVIDCTVINFRTWVNAEDDKPTQNAICPVNQLLLALSDKIISNIKEHEEYAHNSYVTNKSQKAEVKNAKDQ